MDMTTGIIAAAVVGTSFLLTAIFGHIILPILRARKVGQIIREEGPSWHAGKTGTPTMGGICFILAFLLSMAALVIYESVAGTGDYDLIAVALIVCYGVANAMIGFVDDYAKLLKKQNEGLTPKQKMVLQVAVTAGFVALMAITGHLTTGLRIPFTEIRLELGWFAYVVYLLVLVGFVNSTNITDGLDGLASSVCAVVALFILLMGVRRASPELASVAAALLGGVLGFLLYNHHPAKMFMGDTGSLFLGGVIMGCALLADELLLFVLAGLVFVIEMLSSLLQVVYFKITHGKRLFKMAPLHHHFEKCHWSEVGIVCLFSGVTVLLCVLAWFGM